MQQPDTLAVVTPIRALHPLAYTVLLVLAFLSSAFFTYKAIVLLAAHGKDDRGNDTSWALLKTFPSTNGIIAAGIGLAAYFVIGTMTADMIGRPVSQATQTTLSFFIAAMLGVGAGQFWAKRSTDADYQKAKAAAKPDTTINSETTKVAAETVNVTQPGKSGDMSG